MLDGRLVIARCSCALPLTYTAAVMPSPSATAQTCCHSPSKYMLFVAVALASVLLYTPKTYFMPEMSNLTKKSMFVAPRSETIYPPEPLSLNA